MDTLFRALPASVLRVLGSALHALPRRQRLIAHSRAVAGAISRSRQPFEEKIEVPGDELRGRLHQRTTALRRRRSSAPTPRRRSICSEALANDPTLSEPDPRHSGDGDWRHERARSPPTRSCPGRGRVSASISRERDRRREDPRHRSPSSLTVRGKKIDGAGDAHETFPAHVALYGPGDVIGIDPRAIVRTEPRHWITNFEPNYLPFDRVLRRRFPVALHARGAVADNSATAPWLTLVVLEEGEFAEGGNVSNRPLPFITVDGCRRQVSARRRSCGPGRTCTSTAASPGVDIECTAATWRPSSTQTVAREPRPRLFAPALPAHAEAEHRLSRVRDPDVRDRPPRRARPRSRRRAVSATQVAWDDTAAQEPTSSRSTIAGISAPARSATSSIWCAC